MNTEKRFCYSKSHIYGWCVYDRQSGMCPAYEACCDLLPPVRIKEDGTTIMESPILLESEYKAMRLCTRLNGAYKRVNGF